MEDSKNTGGKIETFSEYYKITDKDKQGIVYGSKPLDNKEKQENIKTSDIRQRIAELEKSFKSTDYVGDKSLIEKEIMELEKSLELTNESQGKLKTSQELASEGNIAWKKKDAPEKKDVGEDVKAKKIEDVMKEIKETKAELGILDEKLNNLSKENEKLIEELKKMGLSDAEIKEEMAKRVPSQEKQEEVKPIVKEEEKEKNPVQSIQKNAIPTTNAIVKNETKESKEQYSREQLLNAAEIFCKYNPAAYFNKTPEEQKVAQERALLELKQKHSDREIAAAVNVSGKRNEMFSLKDRVARIKQEYKDARDNPNADISTVKAKYDQQVKDIEKEIRLIDNAYHPLLRELKVANLENQLKNIEQFRDHDDFKEKVQDAELFALSMIQTESIRYQDAKVSTSHAVNPTGWDHVKNIFKRGIESKIFQGYAKMGRGTKWALGAAMVGGTTAFLLPAAVAAAASGAAFIGYKMIRSLGGGVLGYQISKKIIQPLARRAYEKDSARTTQEQQNEALNSEEMTHLLQLARGETDPTEKEKILQKIADKNIELCDKYADKIRRNKKYFIANNVLGTVVAGLLAGKGAQMMTDWVAGPTMLGIFPHGGGILNPETPHKGGGGAIPGEGNGPKGPGIIEPVKPTGPSVNPDDLKAATVDQRGIEGAFRRQLEMHPDKFGFKGDLTNKTAVHEWSGHKADIIARENGYIKADGTETWVKDTGAPGTEGNAAYVLETDSPGSGNIKVQEMFEGKQSGSGGFNSVYEYAHNKPAIHHYTSALENTPETSDHANLIDNANIKGTGNVSGANQSELVNAASEKASIKSGIIDNNITKPYDAADKEWLSNNPIIAKVNASYNLPIEKLQAVHDLQSHNLAFMQDQLNKLNPDFAERIETAHEFNSVLNQGNAHDFLTQNVKVDPVIPMDQPLYDYMTKIQEVTKLSPIPPTPVSLGETNIEFIDRALLDAAKNNLLGNLIL